MFQGGWHSITFCTPIKMKFKEQTPIIQWMVKSQTANFGCIRVNLAFTQNMDTVLHNQIVFILHITIYHKTPFSRATNFVRFGDFQEICFTKNQQEFYCDADCRLKRRQQCRFMKIVSSNFLFSPFAKFVAVEKRHPMVVIVH